MAKKTNHFSQQEMNDIAAGITEHELNKIDTERNHSFDVRTFIMFLIFLAVLVVLGALLSYENRLLLLVVVGWSGWFYTLLTSKH